uniref:SCAN box domain-containing protein n=1 Tax=Nothobranchius furzeri TaxID=105023 RepID=A0A8C6LKW5_NOTFU
HPKCQNMKPNLRALDTLRSEDSSEYIRVKEAILTKYEINDEVYQQRFREPGVRGSEMPREFCNHLKDLYVKWLHPERRRKEEIGEILILEQFYRSLPSEIRVWVRGENSCWKLKWMENQQLPC